MPKDKSRSKIEVALENNVITKEEADLLANAQKLANEAIQVDSFKVEDFGSGKLNIS